MGNNFRTAKIQDEAALCKAKIPTPRLWRDAGIAN